VSKSPKAQVTQDGGMDDGVSRSSKEASNDRGAKGWRIMIAEKRN
jgi:hypothetical protein